MRPEPGVHRVPYEEYASWDAVRGSVLELFEKTAAHARQEMLHPSEPTAAMEIGTAIHCSIFEPSRFRSEFAIRPKADRRTNKGKALVEAFEKENAGKTIMVEDEHQVATSVSESVWAHPIARQLLEGPGLNEVSALWQDAETGIHCKMRMDRLTMFAGYPTIVDLKNLRDASERGFSNAVAKYGWHRRSAMYLDGASALDNRPRKYIFIAVEKEPPFYCQTYELIPTALNEGRVGWRANLYKYKYAVEANDWSYPMDLVPLDLPRWAQTPKEY
jgi:hypothetical protein